MILYNEKEEKVRFRTSEDNFIDKGLYGNVYRTSLLTCAKIYRGHNAREIDPEVLKKIRDLSLRNFYEIYDLLYAKDGTFKGYFMKYYDSFDMDILTTPVDYTLNNYFVLRDSIAQLTSNNIWAFDMHEENVILGESTMTVIDADLFTFNKFYSQARLAEKNNQALNSLFYQLYIETINKYHQDYVKYIISKSVQDLFSAVSEKGTYDMTKKLIRYKYPIDYLKTCK